jgi:hypothetical protein
MSCSTSTLPHLEVSTLDWDSSSDERDRAYMQNVHIRDSDIRAGYAFPREPGLYHSGVLASGGAEVRVPNIRTEAPTPPPSGIPRRGIATTPVFPNAFPIRRGFCSYVWHSHFSPPTG